MECDIVMCQATSETITDPQRDTDLASLQADCVEQMERFRQEHTNDPTPCLLLFRKAILHRDPCAWEALVVVYRPHIQRWIRKRGFSADTSHLDELVQEAIVRFWRAYSPKQLAQARSLAETLRYWQDCAGSAYLDWVRRHCGDPASLDTEERGIVSVRPTEDLPQTTLTHGEARAHLWRVVNAQCLDEVDRRLVHAVFVEGLRPRQVFLENRGLFSSVNDVYKRLRNIKDRLRRTPNLRELLEDCC
jgi:DNA-directed RNA polymerase specialized sigma24 family protein